MANDNNIKKVRLKNQEGNILHPETEASLIVDLDSKLSTKADLVDGVLPVEEIKGYNGAAQGDMLVKDVNQGIVWVKPLDESALREAVAAAEASKNQAGAYAAQAGNSAIAADTAAGNANRINQQTMNWVNKKFWWGTLEEYNDLESIDAGTFYFITAER